MQTRDAVVAFVDAINARDVDRIAALCSDDHLFIDAHGNATDASRVAAAWAGYFRFMPHYGVRADAILCEGADAAIFGEAWGSLDAEDATRRAWRRPCAWRARVTDGQIRLWQVYVDTKPVFDLL